MKELQKLYPGIKFASLAGEEDAWFKEGLHESKESICLRAHDFMEEMLAKEEDNILVFTHSVFLKILMAHCFPNLDASFKEHLQRPFLNCELRSLVVYHCEPEEGGHPMANTDFIPSQVAGENW